MTTEEKDRYWLTALKDAESLDRCAQRTDRNVEYITGALVLTIQAIFANDTNEDYSNWQRDKEDLLDTMRVVGSYAIKRNDGQMIKVNLTSEYAELEDILKEVFKDERKN